MSGAIDVHALARAFGDKRAVDGVDLSVAAGEIYGFLGPNGAGKSTMVRMLTTLLAPTGGSARVAGFDVTTDAEKVRLRIGVALQDAALDGKQTGRRPSACVASPSCCNWSTSATRSTTASTRTRAA